METIVSNFLISHQSAKSRAEPISKGGKCAVQNSEIFTLTYGSIVRQLITDLEDIEEVNKQLDIM